MRFAKNFQATLIKRIVSEKPVTTIQKLTTVSCLTEGESSISESTGVVALHNFAVESIPYVMNIGKEGWGITPLHVELSAFKKDTTDPVAFS